MILFAVGNSTSPADFLSCTFTPSPSKVEKLWESSLKIDKEMKAENMALESFNVDVC